MEQDEFITRQMLAAAGRDYCLTADTHSARESALEELPGYLGKADLMLDNDTLALVMTIYFMSTYAVTPRKHEVKKNINTMLRKVLLSEGISDASGTGHQRAGSNPPRLLVITNLFTSTHVMYRCFGKSLAVLKERYECIALSLDKMDYIAAQCFHRVYQLHLAPIHFIETVRQLRKLILEIAPDVIVFADIAMHPFGVFLSNLRLAPLQVLLAGHPAPSHSECIDAFICEDAYRSCTPQFSEPVITFPTAKFSVREPLTKEPFQRTMPRINSTEKRILVPATLHKITYPFLIALQKVAKETGAEIHLTGNQTTGNHEMHELLKATVPMIQLIPSMPYEQFLRFIVNMDFFMLTTPFTGFSSVLDCFSQAVPGALLHARSMESMQAEVATARGGSGCSIYLSHYAENVIKEIEDKHWLIMASEQLRALYSGEGYVEHMDLYNGPSDGIANALKSLLDGSAEFVK